MLSRLKQTVRDQPLLRAGALRFGALVRSLASAAPGVYPLCYHHVTASAGETFAAQIAFLQKFGTFIRADEAVARLERGRATEGRSFVLTLDDGYRDNLDVAMPVLRACGVPAMLFLVSDWVAAPPADGQAYLDVDGVRQWLGAGMDIGSHSASHRRFTTLSHADARDEMNRSADALAALAGKPIRHFACPWGVAGADFAPAREVPLAAAAGYRTFFTTRRGHATRSADLTAMPRHVLEPEWPCYQLQTLMGGPAIGRR